MKTNHATIVRNLRILYPFWMIIGIFSIIYIPSTLIDSNNAVNTINNIENNQFLFRLGIVSRIIVQLLFIIIPFLFYKLFCDFNKSTASLMLILSLISIPIALHSETNMLGILASSNPDEVLDLLEVYRSSINIATIFWGLWLFPLGYLVYHSTLFPKLIGIFLYIGGLGYLINAFMTILFPDFSSLNSILEIMTIGELLFILWFVFRGVNKQPSTIL